MERQAIPGAMKLPPGARDREKFQLLEARVQGLEKSLKSLADAFLNLQAFVGSKFESDPDNTALVARAHELGLGAPSQLARWSVKKLQAAITEKEQE
jgi:hypothetical protein